MKRDRSPRSSINPTDDAGTETGAKRTDSLSYEQGEWYTSRRCVPKLSGRGDVDCSGPCAFGNKANSGPTVSVYVPAILNAS